MRFIHCILLSLFLLNAAGQFYNGHQMTFGKNRVQYNDFYWRYYRDTKFDVYYNQDGYNLATYTLAYVNDNLERLQKTLEHRINKRLIFIVYNKLTDYRQSNIGLISLQDGANLGGETTILDNKVFLYFDGNYQNFNQSIDRAISQIIIYELLFGADFKDNFTNSNLLYLPEWFIEGLIQYNSVPWNFDLDNKLKDAVLNKRIKKYSRESKEQAAFVGHAFWRYVANRYGSRSIPRIVFLTRIYKSVKNGFNYSMGLNIKDLWREVINHYEKEYQAHLKDPDIVASDPTFQLHKTSKNRTYLELKQNPTNNLFSYVTNKNGKYKVWIYDRDTGKKKKILRRENDLEQIADYTFPQTGWHPSGELLYFITEEKGGLKMYIYNVKTDEFFIRNFLYFEKVLDFDFSNDGSKIVMSAVKQNKSDIFIYDVSSASHTQLTNDLADDVHPTFTFDDKKIIFSSNRHGDSLNYVEHIKDPVFNLTHDLFQMDVNGDPKSLIRLHPETLNNQYQPLEIKPNTYSYLADNNGIINKRLLTVDSTISHIDTIIHYRYIRKDSPLTNHDRSILEQSGSFEKSNEIIFKDERFQLLKLPVRENPPAVAEPKATPFRKQYSKDISLKDSIGKIVITDILYDNIENDTIFHQEDTIKVKFSGLDINNYVFEREKVRMYNNQLKNKRLRIVFDTIHEKKVKIRNYANSFFINSLVTQVDFDFLNYAYQVYNPEVQGYANPGMNAMFKIGTKDLFEDYRLIFGVRFGFDFDDAEYLLSFENLKYRLDKQYIFHRQTYVTNDFQDSFLSSSVQTISNNLSYILKYPLNQVLAIQGTAKVRIDQEINLSVNNETLDTRDQLNTWGSLKGEIIFDNSKELGVNLYKGFRSKVFIEGYRQVDVAKSDLFVAGMDLRHYLPIHRELIWANRLAASSSFGNRLLLYYLGGVDNWYPIFTDKPQYDNTVDIAQDLNYAFHTLATNLRGFPQNIRNGNNFAVINSELRWPVFRYLFNRPLSSNFWNTFQLVGFCDIGSAWHGIHPYAGQNAYDKSTHTVFSRTNEEETPSVILEVDSNRDPIVMGYGFGVRAMLLGYFIRLDWANGIENRNILPRVFYFSLNLDF